MRPGRQMHAALQSAIILGDSQLTAVPASLIARLRRGISLRPRPARRAAGPCARSRRLRRHGKQDAFAGAAARMADGAAGHGDRTRWPEGVRRQRIADDRSTRACRLPHVGRNGPAPAQNAPGLSATPRPADGGTRRVPARTCRIGGVAAGLHLMLNLPPAPMKTRSSRRRTSARSRVRRGALSCAPARGSTCARHRLRMRQRTR